jgi:hypothetical protein
MRKIFFLFCALFLSLTQFSQEVANDSITYNKNIDFYTKREFKDNLKEKYADKEFIYTEDVAKKRDSSPTNPAFLSGFIYFMVNIFPYVLGGIIVFIILKTFLGTEIGFWNFKKHKKIPSEKLVFEDEDIHEVDLEGLLKDSIIKKEYRLAIRYYYLSVLKELSTKKVIHYHKDKTNSEYLLEIENLTARKDFSYLSYVYSYVWYGDFPVNEPKFKVIESKYKSFLNSTI